MRRRISFLRLAAASLLIAALPGCNRTSESVPAALPKAGTPEHARALRHFRVGFLALETGIADRARKEFLACASLAPGEPAAFINLAWLDLQAGNDSAAEAELNDAEALIGTAGPVLLGKADLARRRGQGETVLHVLRAGALAGDVSLVWPWWRERRRQGGADSLALLEALLSRDSGNIALTAEKIDALCRRGDTVFFQRAENLAQNLGDSAAQARGRAAASAWRNGETANARLEMAFFRNLLIPHPAYQRDLRRLGFEDDALAKPVASPLRLTAESRLAPADTALAFASRPWPDSFPPVQVAVNAPLAADLDVEGDLDSLVMPPRGGLRIRWNLDGKRFANGPDLWPGKIVRKTVVADFTGEGIPDVLALGADGTLAFFRAERPGFFATTRLLHAPNASAMALADVDNDGDWEIALADGSGRIVFHSFSPEQNTFVEKPGRPGPRFASAPVNLLAGDVDNNGEIDWVGISGTGGGEAWLQNGAGGWLPAPLPGDFAVQSLADLNGDGHLDLSGTSGDRRPAWLENLSRRYPGLKVSVAPAKTRGDGRINALGIGSVVDLISGGVTQRRLLEDSTAHFGLGLESPAGLRTRWPNGTLQSDFDFTGVAALRVEQRLKGSCPWVFAFDGRGFSFVTDFIWRSPLGLQINAQATAPVVQTFDRVRFPPGLPAARDSGYDVRITAELWETHFFDYAALTVVDHAPDLEAYVDERFCFPPPPSAVRLFHAPVPVARAWDARGQDVTGVVRARDNVFLEDFPLGQRQGVAGDHWVEFEIAPDTGTGPWVLIAQGWIYPTDSSINRALGQAGSVKPEGLRLLGWRNGRWETLQTGLGFPAGKSKTLLIPLREGVRRYRLATNLEIYWDALASAREAVGAPRREITVPPAVAALRWRGFSAFTPRRGGTPELPRYGSLPAASLPRWRNLEGFHTRYGDIRPLLGKIDDRYVIMNAGDEMVLRFPMPAVEPGAARTLFLDGDGWEKDGDYNTLFGETVTPLPSHDRPDYSGPRLPLQRDPVFLRHGQDWVQYHTRYVPGSFRELSLAKGNGPR